MNHVFIRDSEYAHRCRIFRQSFSNQGSEASEDAVFLYREYASCLPGRLDDGFPVKRLYAGEIKDPCAYALLSECDTGLQCMIDSFPCPYYREVIAFEKCVCLSDLESEVVIVVNIRNSCASDSYVCGMRTRSLTSFAVRRASQGRNTVMPGNVLSAAMS